MRAPTPFENNRRVRRRRPPQETSAIDVRPARLKEHPLPIIVPHKLPAPYRRRRLKTGGAGGKKEFIAKLKTIHESRVLSYQEAGVIAAICALPPQGRMSRASLFPKVLQILPTFGLLDAENYPEASGPFCRRT